MNELKKYEVPIRGMSTEDEFGVVYSNNISFSIKEVYILISICKMTYFITKRLKLKFKFHIGFPTKKGFLFSTYIEVIKPSGISIKKLHTFIKLAVKGNARERLIIWGKSGPLSKAV